MAATDEADIYNFSTKNDTNSFNMSNSTNFDVEDPFLDVLSGCIFPKGWKWT